MSPHIKNRYTGAVIYEGTGGMTARQMLEAAVAVKTNLNGAELTGSDLRSADLRGANLYSADLNSANLNSANLSDANMRDANMRGANLNSAELNGADLSDANMRGANLNGANLSDANLSDANIRGANLNYADLSGANLTGADLSAANLYGANLRGADLTGADLSAANLCNANLRGAKSAELAIAKTRIIGEGALIGWKKCANNVIVKLHIPAEAKRSHAFGRKCRAEYVDVLEVFGAETGLSEHDQKTVYAVGQRVKPDKFCEDWQNECSHGIHFFITRIEAENY